MNAIQQYVPEYLPPPSWLPCKSLLTGYWFGVQPLSSVWRFHSCKPYKSPSTVEWIFGSPVILWFLEADSLRHRDSNLEPVVNNAVVPSHASISFNNNQKIQVLHLTNLKLRTEHSTNVGFSEQHWYSTCWRNLVNIALWARGPWATTPTRVILFLPWKRVSYDLQILFYHMQCDLFC